MTELLEYFVLCLTSFFTMYNPITNMPVYMTLTSGLSEKEAHKTAIKAVSVAFITACVFALTGNYILKIFQISIYGLQIVGFFVFFKLGSDMLNARLTNHTTAEKTETDYATDIAITPLGIPLICGPGLITMSILRISEATSCYYKLAFFVALFLIACITLLLFLASRYIAEKIGRTGLKVITKIMGLILMVIAVEFLIAGSKPILQDIFNIVPLKS